MRDLIKALKALSDETRLRILNLVLERECCVCEVVQALVVSQSRASRNLSLLRDAGLLQRRKEGLWAFYSISRETVPTYLLELMLAVKTALDGNQTAAKDIERLRSAEPGCAWCARNQAAH